MFAEIYKSPTANEVCYIALLFLVKITAGPKSMRISEGNIFLTYISFLSYHNHISFNTFLSSFMMYNHIHYILQIKNLYMDSQFSAVMSDLVIPNCLSNILFA